MSNKKPNPIDSHLPAAPDQGTKDPIRLRDGYPTPQQRWNDMLLAPTGPFRPVIERYMTEAELKYKPVLIKRVRATLGNFFRFVVENESIRRFDEIRPSTVTRFMQAERERGIRNGNFVGHLSTFFVWLISEELYDYGNPVVARFHN